MNTIFYLLTALVAPTAEASCAISLLTPSPDTPQEGSPAFTWSGDCVRYRVLFDPVRPAFSGPGLDPAIVTRWDSATSYQVPTFRWRVLQRGPWCDGVEWTVEGRAPDGSVTTAGPWLVEMDPDGDGAAEGCAPETPTIAFESAAVAVDEGAVALEVVVTLSDAAESEVTAQVALTAGTARLVEGCTGADASIDDTTLVFAAGERSAVVEIAIRDDEFNELDEDFTLALTDLSGADPGDVTQATVTILDDDRVMLVDLIEDYGAAGDGVTDDTEILQAAIDDMDAAGGGVLVFPAGYTFIFNKVYLAEGITYEGTGAVITRGVVTDRFDRIWETPWDGDTGAPMIIRGFTFDGNREAQPDYEAFEYGQAHLLFLTGDATDEERLRAYVEDIEVRESVGDGLSLYFDVEVDVCGLDAWNDYRGGLVATGGNSILRARDITTGGDVHASDVEVDGYGDVLTADITFEDLSLTGDFDVAVSQDSVVEVRRLTMTEPPFYIYAQDSEVLVEDSTIVMGYNDTVRNRFVYPNDVTLRRCTLTLDEGFQNTDGVEGDNTLYAAHVYWTIGTSEESLRSGQRLTFEEVTFLVGDEVEEADSTYVARASGGTDYDNSVTIRDSTISDDFDDVFHSTCDICILEE